MRPNGSTSPTGQRSAGMRPATVVTLAVLLVAIVGALVVQLVISP